MKYIAVDLGAGSGRIVAGTPASEPLTPDPLNSDPPPASGGADDGLDILYRFTTPSVVLPTGIHWDIAAIFNNIKKGLRAAFLKYGDEIVSISVDSWGVDYGLLDAGSELIGLPYHYRDQRTDTIMDGVFSIISERDIYERTGIQFMQLNTLFQQIAFMKSHPDLFSCARSYLSIPDLIIYWLCGEMTNERTHASTTQLFSPHQNTWDRELMDILKLPKTIFREIVPSGTPLAPLLPQVQQEVGAPASVQVIAGAGHDTQAASFTVPASADTAFLSCGTWSVMGIESSTAIISDTGFAYSASNEASARGGYNLLKNLLGLWLLQECKAEWDAEHRVSAAGTGSAARAAGTAGAAESDYAKLIEQARCADAPEKLIDVNNDIFLKSRHQAGSMQERINRHLSEKGAQPCTERSQIVRVIIESLAELYRKTLNELEEISGRKITRLHIIGGGAQNDLLCERTTELSGREVIVGNPEATAIGNISIQQQTMQKLE